MAKIDFTIYIIAQLKSKINYLMKKNAFYTLCRKTRVFFELNKQKTTNRKLNFNTLRTQNSFFIKAPFSELQRLTILALCSLNQKRKTAKIAVFVKYYLHYNR